MQLRARLDAELVDEATARIGERLERVRLAAGPVEREHERCSEPLAQRMRGDEGLELRNDPRRLAELEARVE